MLWVNMVIWFCFKDFFLQTEKRAPNKNRLPSMAIKPGLGTDYEIIFTCFYFYFPTLLITYYNRTIITDILTFQTISFHNLQDSPSSWVCSMFQWPVRGLYQKYSYPSIWTHSDGMIIVLISFPCWIWNTSWGYEKLQNSLMYSFKKLSKILL